jgi:sulfoxide reductase heme-binding subunit YedZ
MVQSASIHAVLSHAWAKPLVFMLCLMPCGWLIFAAAASQLGANPAETLIRSTGDWTLRLLCCALAITPLRVTLHLTTLARYRRMLGLFVYFYAMLHLLAYSWLDHGFEVAEIARDIAKRPFILVGFAAVVFLTPLALTSFQRAIRWLGGKRWQLLHRLVYGVAILALLHFFWMRAGKNNFAEVAVYAGIMGALLGWRLVRRVRQAFAT